jgi:hypothetical protein
MRATTLAFIAALAAVAAAASAQAADAAPENGNLLRQVRHATAPFRDVEAAKAAGYKPSPHAECAADPKYGGMGIHYGNAKLIADGDLDPLHPEVLVYQPGQNGKLSLGAVEYFKPDADQDLDTNGDRPTLFGMPFDGPMLGHEPGMPKHYDLHVWLFKHNPAGLFAAFNPSVRCP